MAASARNLEKLTSELDKAEQKNAQALKDVCFFIILNSLK